MSNVRPGQTVVFEATGLPARQFVVVTQCAADLGTGILLESCEIPRSQVVRTDASGTIRARVSITAIVEKSVDGARREWNCITQGCVLAIGPNEDFPADETTPIRWAPSASVPDRPALDLVSQNAAPGNRHRFVVEGSGFGAGARVSMVQCPTLGSGDGLQVDECLYGDSGRITRADGAGSFSATVPVAELFQRNDGSLIDCRRTPNPCALAVLQDESDVDSRMTWTEFTVE